MLQPAHVRPVRIRHHTVAILAAAAAACVIAVMGLIAALVAPAKSPACVVPDGYELVRVREPAPATPIVIPTRHFAQPPPMACE